MKTTLKMLSDFRSLDTRKEEFFHLQGTFMFGPHIIAVPFYGSLQIMDGLFILN